MNIVQIESNLQKFITTYKQGAFIYNFLLAFGTPKATVKRLQKGGLNLSKIEGELAWKKKLFFKSVRGEDLHQLLELIKKNDRALKHTPRFIIVTDNESLLAVDTKTKEGLDIPISDLPKHFDFFLPLAGMEKTQHQNENPADIKAAGKMAKLFDEIKKDNHTRTAEEVHNLNVFLSRLLFCFFAEDTGIFEETQFTNAIASHTQEDGSDLNTYLDTLFEVLNTDNKHRKKLPAYLTAFPYVNGGLFRHRHHAPVFNHKSRATIIECGSLQWKDIHPDIFGSMFQAVIKTRECTTPAFRT
ncbi:MAG: type IIL restriction-modification enzyme MmeI [Bacteroidota bacterium]